MGLNVKICGITSMNHVKACINGKANMIGLMFYRKSPRFIKLKKAKEISDFAKNKIKRVGVIANLDIEEIKEIIKNVDLDYLQFHGNESCDFLKKVKKELNLKIIKAIRIEKRNDIKKILSFNNVSDYILLDTKIVKNNNLNFKIKSKKLDWNMLKKIKNKRKLILSGGINSENLKDAINASNFKFVDVSSSLEKIPGKKSVKRISNFLKLATKL